MSGRERTRVAIVGAGPAGLLLARLLDLAGIDSVLIERQTPEHVAGRIRAGVLESSTVDVLRRAGLADRLLAESGEHHGIRLQRQPGATAAVWEVRAPDLPIVRLSPDGDVLLRVGGGMCLHPIN